MIVNEFMARINEVLAWDKGAVEATTEIKKILNKQGNYNQKFRHVVRSQSLLLL